jgi:hypothetical protein
MRAWRGVLGGVLPVVLAGCGAVNVKPEHALPKPLMQPLSVHAGLLLDEELRRYHHDETRAGADWKVDLGAGHDQFFRSIFGSSFNDLKVYENLDAARAATGLQVLFRPQIEQYSFATSRETSGSYWAVTIRYRIAVLTPSGELLDTLTLTGYGSALGERGNAASLTAATRVAMRDAAAKFLVQMPRQQLAQKLTAGTVLSAADAATVTVDVVEAVPIDPPAPAG